MQKKRKLVNIGTVICTRKIFLEKKGKSITITVRLGKPRKQKMNWVCAFYVSHIGLKEPIVSCGEDGFQALMLALKGIRLTLDRVDGTLSWVFGEKEDTGFPHFIPRGWGLDFSRKVERIVAAEERKFIDDINKRNK